MTTATATATAARPAAEARARNTTTPGCPGPSAVAYRLYIRWPGKPGHRPMPGQDTTDRAAAARAAARASRIGGLYIAVCDGRAAYPAMIFSRGKELVGAAYYQALLS